MQLKLNSDLGEGTGNDARLMPYLFACNIACGGHFGDASTIRTTVKLALQHQVKIGAHPSYPDKANFGRKSIKLTPAVLQQSLKDQLFMFCKVLEDCGASLHHIKAHGALYNDIAKNENLAETYLSAIKAYKNNCLLFVPDHSVVKKLALRKDFPICIEAFADRNYTDDGCLVPRSHPQAVIHQPENAVKQVGAMLNLKQVVTLSGKKIPIQAETFCLHSDHKNTLKIARELHVTFNQKEARF